MKETRASIDWIPTFDGWRAIAVTWVIACHANSSWSSKTALWTRLGLRGYQGVDLFFVLSGFLITWRLARRGSVNFRDFYGRRVARIFPAEFFYLAIVALLHLFSVVRLYRNDIWSCVFFWRNYLQSGSVYTLHFWSLSVEEQFYLVWPAVLAGLGFRRAFGVALLLVPFSLYRHHEYLLVTYFDTLVRLAPIAIGATFALGYSGFPGFKVWVDRLTRPVWLPVWGVAWCFAAWYASNILFTLVTPWLMLCTAFQPQTALGRVLESAPFRQLGKLSFGVYIWQNIFFAASPAERMPWPWVLLQTHQGLGLAATLGMAWVSFTCVERPAGRWLRSRLAGEPDTIRAADVTQ